MSVEIAPWVVEEMEERREREKIMWRRNARLARDRREAAESEARAVEEAAYPVRARMGAVGDGRERSQVSLVLVCLFQILFFSILVRKFVLRRGDDLSPGFPG